MADATIDENVEMLHTLTDGALPKDHCLKFLQTYNNDLNEALNKFYDNDFSSLKAQPETKWDNTAFQADRYGQQEEMPNSFQIFPHSAAPSRPPSRTSHHSGGSTTQTPLPSIETTIDQESGVIGAHGAAGPYFGPATKEHYDTSQWALVPTSTAAELVPDPLPSSRKREQGGLAILKPLPSGDYLPALLTLLHSIPLFRNALLAPQVLPEDYGADNEWWKGTPIQTTRIVGDAAEADRQWEVDILIETQRLMAFLDSSDRAYASVEALVQSESFSRLAEALQIHNQPELFKFLMIWGNAYTNNSPMMGLNGVLRSCINASGEQVESWFLDAAAVHSNTEHPLTIYDVLDQNLFPGQNGIAFVTELSNVLILKLARSDRNSNSLDVKIPATLYADRYMEANAPQIEAALQEMKQYKDQIHNIEVQTEKIRYHEDKKSGKKLDGLQLLKTSMKAFEPSPIPDIPYDPENEATIRKIQKIYENVERKLAVLDAEKQKLQDALKEIASDFRAPIDSSSIANTDNHSVTDPKTIFQLRGVSTRPNTLYLYQPDPGANPMDEIDGPKDWWKIVYAYQQTDEPYIFHERVHLTTVLEAASAEHPEALLVYANSAALDTEPVPLSKQLHDFVQRDNLSFMQELQDEQPVEQDWQPSEQWDDSWQTNEWVDESLGEGYAGAGVGNAGGVGSSPDRKRKSPDGEDDGKPMVRHVEFADMGTGQRKGE
ncbi:hypothetical protein GQ43DRAFT_211334 [Delitschia confertaspora ATCC 74209]|uniref:Ubiquitin interaction motif protein n=1 Tax=Delitschia confertaspora ATCC 74209 TaxID=1513339 RepID=A0A9P4JWW2_9PLEO|nr:hypothetical protein GQ43DRAFT_211334 [Delitschia confertaspora ATCC 74209]